VTDTKLDQLCVNTIRTLSIDAVQQARSGHPGTPMALTAEVRNSRLLVHVILSWIDTSLDSPDDIVPWQVTPPVRSSTYRAQARSVVVLYAKSEPGKFAGWRWR
jgi:Transketolase, thiamine diphosphate binding domain